MPPVVAAIASVLVSIGISTAVATVIATILVSIALSLATQFLFGKSPPKLNQGQELSLKIDPTMPRQVLLGTTATGGSQAFAFTWSIGSKMTNGELARINVLSDRPCTGLVGVYEGPDLLSFAGDITIGNFACNQHLTDDGKNQMWLRIYLGSDTPTADSELVSNSGGAWTTNHKGKGLCYVYTHYSYAPDKAFPNGEPALVYVMRGAKCYDDRKDSTVSGGSGTHRLATPTTWEYSDNTAVVTSQFLRGFYTGSVRILGVGCENRDLDSTMLFSAYNTCDQVITNADASTQKRYFTGYLATATNTAADGLTDLMFAMDGAIYDRGGSITILPGATHTPVFDLTDEDIVWTAQKSWQPQANVDQLCNFISGTYIDKVSIYQQNTFPTLRNPTWEANDGGSRFAQQFNFNAITDHKQVQRTTKRIYASTRFQGNVAFTGPAYLLEMEQGDWFTVTSARWGFTTKYFMCQERDLLADMSVAVVARETDPSVVGWTASVDEKARTDTTWTSPAYTLPVPSITVTPYSTYDTTSGMQLFGFKAALADTLIDIAGGSNTHIEFQYALSSNLTVTYAGGIIALDQVQVTIVGLDPGTNFSVRARITAGTRHGVWSSWSTVNTPASVPLTTDQILYTDMLPLTGHLGAALAAATDFYASNNQNKGAVLAPFFNTDGTDIDHTLNTDGSADLSMEFNYSAPESDIDGFEVAIGVSPSGTLTGRQPTVRIVSDIFGFGN